MYVADWGNERVQVLDPDGGFAVSLRGESDLSKWAEDFMSANTEEAEARSRSNLEKDLDLFIQDPTRSRPTSKSSSGDPRRSNWTARAGST